jgi:parallel beta-helix repeat protein
MGRLSCKYWLSGFLFLLSLNFVAFSSAATTSGNLIIDEIWSGTITLTGDVTVPEGVTLTIEHGTEVIVSAQSDDTAGGNDGTLTELIVNGSLIAEGTEANPIVFTSTSSSPGNNDWGGIRASSGESLVLKHCTVEYAGLGIEYRASSGNTNVAIENSVIRHTSGDGIAIYTESGVIRTVSVVGNEVTDNDGIGIRLQATGSNTQLMNTVTGNAVHDNGSYGIYLDTQFSAKSTSTISDNQIYNNVTYGLYSYGYSQVQVSAEITGNTIHDSGMGVYIYNYYQVTSPSLRIAGNTIYNSSDGIYCWTRHCNISVSPVIEDNNIYDNTGIGLYVYGYDSSTIAPTISHNTVTNNGDDGIKVQRSSSIYAYPVSTGDLYFVGFGCARSPSYKSR